MRAATSHEPRATSHSSRPMRGFTLVEMIVVVAITGIIAAAVAVFIRRPVEGYVDAARRAELSDIADTALRRMTRDLRSALPNSIRITTSGNIRYLEYLQTSGGGRYRSDQTSAATGDILDFAAPDSTFDVIGPVPAISAGSFIVIYNLAANGGTANAYVGDNRADYSGSSATTITLASAFQFPFVSPGKRFHVVQYPVTYECDPDAGLLRRYWGYTIVATPQPTPTGTAPGGGGAPALLATNVTGCEFTYTAVTQRLGLVRLSLQVASGGGSVRLFQQVHVNNVP